MTTAPTTIVTNRIALLTGDARRIANAAIMAAGTNTRMPVAGLTGTTVVANALTGDWSVEYHGTRVFAIVGASVHFRSGGFVTATTARRINAALVAEGLAGWRVNRKKGWFIVTTPKGQYHFSKEIIIQTK